jgi:hypothetical protein
MERLKEKSRLLHLGYVSEVNYQPDPPPAPEITPWQDIDYFDTVRVREMTVEQDQLPYGLSDDYMPCYDNWYNRVMDAISGIPPPSPSSSQLDVPSDLFEDEDT